MRKLTPPPAEIIDLDLLKQAIEERFELDDIRQNINTRIYKRARALFFIIADLNNDYYTLNEIGAFLNKDRSAVIYARNKMPEYMKEREFKKLYYSFDPDKLTIASRTVVNTSQIEQAEQEIKILRRRLNILQYKLNNRNGICLKEAYRPLVELLNTIPGYHVETVKLRLEPIVKMLEKPSMHNYLPKN